MSAKPAPSAEQVEDILLSCRYGELDEVKEFVEAYGADALVEARDDRGNTVLHMCCGNGHLDILEYLAPHLPASLYQTTNTAGTPPLHWAILNNHVAVVKHLVEMPEKQGGGIALLHQQSAAKRDAFAEALFHGEGKEEVAGWIEGYLFKIEGGDDLENGEVKMSAGEVEAGDGADEPATTETETGAGGKGSSSDSSAEVEKVSEGVDKVKLGQ